MFRAPGVSCVKTANSLIYQIRRPFPPVHLINVGPLASVAEWDPRVWGRVMALWVWAPRPGGGHQRVLPRAHGYVRGSSPRIFVDDRVSMAPERAQERLVSFVRTAVEHLQGRRSHVQQDRHDP
jgi:hypothetical protein